MVIDINNIETSITDNDFMFELYERRPTKQRNLSIDEFVEKITVPAGKFKGSKYSLERTPYLSRPLWYMSPQSAVQELYLMFSAQTSKTSIADICSVFYTVERPTEIIFAAMEAGAARKWATTRYMNMCKSAGVVFRTSSEDKKSRASGNTTFTKEFDGGNIDIVSSQSSSQLASSTKQVIFADEISRWKGDINGEGSPLKLLQARGKQWGDQSKFLGMSTPHIEDDLIHSNFKRGTQEEFHINCPLGCGASFPLEWEDDKIEPNGGFHIETEGGKVIDAVYICPKCGNAFKEESKYRFLKSGVWVPKVENPDDPSVASMYLNVLYSPFETWIKVAKEQIKAQEDPLEEMAFTNLYKGLPYNEIGTRPEAENIKMNNVAKIQQGDIPNDTLYLSIGADVQRGKEKYQKMTDEELQKEIKAFQNTKKDPHNQGLPRIEILLLGTSWAWRTHGVTYKVFYGQTTDPNDGAFEQLRQWIIDNKLTFKRIDGTTVLCPIVLVDSGDGERVTTVYDFCESFPGGMVFPCKGNGAYREGMDKKGDERKMSDLYAYRESKVSASMPLITVSTNLYKSKIYRNLNIERIMGSEQKPHFTSFPENFPDIFFKMLTAEEKWADGSFHAKGRRNEALDILVYASAGAEYWLSKHVDAKREYARKVGYKKADIKKNVNTRTCIDKMKADLIKVQKSRR